MARQQAICGAKRDRAYRLTQNLNTALRSRVWRFLWYDAVMATIRGIYKRERRAALERAEYRCEECGERRWLQVHHRVQVRDAIKRGWSPARAHAPDNLMALCKECHLTEHQRRLETERPQYRQRREWRRMTAELQGAT